jgi:hypothetical protein
MIFFELGLYLRVEELDNGPKPFPLQSGFSMGCAYRALGLYNPSETSDAYFVLSNDRDEIWFICNRHLRTVGLIPQETRLRVCKLVALRSVVPSARKKLGQSEVADALS